MSFGMRIWGPTGSLELDENSFTVMIIYSAIVQFSGSRTQYISLPGITAATHSAVCLPIQDYSTNGQNTSAIQATPIVSNDAVVVYFGRPSGDTGPVGGAPQRLLVMRYR